MIPGRETSRICTVKVRVVRRTAQAAALPRHLGYLSRDGVTRGGEKARMFGPDTDDADIKDFAERSEDDRHHFRFIVSPEDAADMADLKRFTRDLMTQAEKDLGTELDWIAVDHWNTDNPHVHVILRGRADDGQDLVISRDYIREGLRDRAQDLITRELGPRHDHEIRRSLMRQVEAERWTALDRQLLRDAGKAGVIDMAPAIDGPRDDYLPQKVGRLRHLERLGLADRGGQAQWVLDRLRDREVGDLAEKIAAETSLPFERTAGGDTIAGTYRRRFALASGRFAMIDDGLSFKLVPCPPPPRPKDCYAHTTRPAAQPWSHLPGWRCSAHRPSLPPPNAARHPLRRTHGCGGG